MRNIGEIAKIHQKQSNEVIYCKNCGHSMLMVTERRICTHCGKYVYKTPEIEFKYKMKQEKVKQKNKE